MFKFLRDKDLLNLFIKISLPVMLASLITFFVNFLDNLMVGTVSNSAVSGVYAANQITWVYQMACFGVLEGAGIFIQQYKGKEDAFHIKQLVKYKWIAILVLMVIAIPLLYFLSPTLIGIQCEKDVMKAEILEEGMKYFNIAVLAFIPFSLSCIFFYTYQEIGYTRYPMYSSALALVTNTGLNSLLIFGFNMGVQGAAIATLVSRCVELVFLIVLTKVKNLEYFKIKGIKIENELLKSIIKKGSFLFLNEMGFTFGVILQNFALSQRNGVLSSISIVSMVQELFHVFAIGFAVSLGVIVGQNLGRDHFNTARSNAKSLLRLGLLITLCISILLIAFSPLIPKLYKKVTLDQKQLGTYLIIILACALPTWIFALGSYYILRAGGRTLDTMIFDTGSSFLLYVPVSWILALCTDLNIIWIYIIIRCIDILKALVGMFLLKREKWLQNITLKDAELI